MFKADSICIVFVCFCDVGYLSNLISKVMNNVYGIMLWFDKTRHLKMAPTTQHNTTQKKKFD